MAKAGTKARLTLEAEIRATTRAIRDRGDTARIRKAALELLDAIHEKMAGVTDEEVVAILAAEKDETRLKAATRQQRAGEHPRRRRASA